MAAKETLEKIFTLRKEAEGSSRKRRLLLYGAGALVLVGVIGYFVRQYNVLVQGRQMGLSPPVRQERLDSAGGKQTALTRIYELEEKNRYRDSMSLAQEEKALDYIVMDWENLYDVRKKKVKDEPARATAEAPDSLGLLLGLLKTRDSTRLAAASVKRAKKTPARPRKANLSRRSKSQEKLPVYASVPADPFNTVRAPGYSAAGNLPAEAYQRPAGNGLTIPAGEALGNPIPAVVHGGHKVRSGGKVTFRILEEAFVSGARLPRNTLLTGIASFNQGRITFSGFRARGSGNTVPLPLACYDSDMMAGISFGDQSVVESEVRRGAVTSLTDAASNLSYSIPMGSLARATSSIARGAIRGSARNRQTFIYLSDGYRVFLELAPQKQ